MTTQSGQAASSEAETSPSDHGSASDTPSALGACSEAETSPSVHGGVSDKAPVPPEDDDEPIIMTGIVNGPPNATSIMSTLFSVIYESTDRPGQICKVPSPFPQFEQAHEVEKRIYQRLGEHPNLVKVIETDQHGIWLERARHDCLRLYYMRGGEASLQERLKWCEDVAGVLSYVMAKNIRHADISGRNLLIDAQKTILLCDFAGSFIDNEKATILAEDGYRHPDEKETAEPSIRSEIHALGSTIFEIITGKEPYHGTDKETFAKLLEQGKYPDVSEIPLGHVIRKCWQGGFESVDEIAQEIAKFRILDVPSNLHPTT